MLKEVRAREKKESQRQLDELRAEGAQYADLVKTEMASRIEKQVSMIEALLEDKRQLQETVETNQEKIREL